MKKFLTYYIAVGFAGLLAILLTPLGHCQNTTLTVKALADSDSAVWGATPWKLHLLVPGGGKAIYAATGNPVTQDYSGVLSNAGSMTQSVASNAAVLPGGTQWCFTFTLNIPPTAANYIQGPLCLPQISSSSQDVTSYLETQIVAPRFLCVGSCSGYSTAEVTGAPANGTIFSIGRVLWQYNSATGQWVQVPLSPSGTINPCMTIGIACDGVTDDRLATQNLIQGLVSTLGTAYLQYGAGDKTLWATTMIIPTDNTGGPSAGSNSPTVHIQGAGYTWGILSGPIRFGGSEIIMTDGSTTFPTGAKIEALGYGLFEMDHINLVDTGSDCSTFFETTNATPDLHDMTISGSTVSNGTTFSCNVALQLGGTSGNITNDLTGKQNGYKNVAMRNVLLDKISVVTWWGQHANSFRIENVTVTSESGNNTLNKAAFVVDCTFNASFSCTQADSGGGVIGATIESAHYKYVFDSETAVSMIIEPDNFDQSGGYTSMYLGNQAIAGAGFNFIGPVFFGNANVTSPNDNFGCPTDNSIVLISQSTGTPDCLPLQIMFNGSGGSVGLNFESPSNGNIIGPTWWDGSTGTGNAAATWNFEQVAGQNTFILHDHVPSGGNDIAIQLTNNGTSGAPKIIMRLAGGLQSTGTQSISGCSISAHTGGASAGQYTSGTTGACTVTINQMPGASNGWSCIANDITTPADKQGQTANAATSVSISGTTVTGDIVTYACIAY